VDASVASLGTVDQRITQDTDRLTSQAAKLIADTVALPAVIVFYSIHLIYLFNWSVIAACFAYFLCGCAVSSWMAAPLVQAVYTQEALEGGFRAAHSRYQQRLPDIRLLHGEAAEQQTLGAAFAALVSNTQSLIRRRLALSAFTNWFAYTGSLGTLIAHL
jgi:putative ATP-binding cassette transporter